MAIEKTVCVKSSTGRDFAWKSDHAYVKVSSEESGGRYSLIEDNLTAEFRLPRHLHRAHSECFYIVTGKVEFQLDDRTVVLSGGDTLYIPPNEPHAVRCIEPAKMLTLYQPGGLEKLFDAYATMTPEEMADAEKLKAVELTHDSVTL
jgi:quercetin dioxygenase-like cupin family protein